MAFGSLLGTIRDDGQIPWDYDVDVIIPYSERYALIDALDRDLPKNMYYYCPETNEECRHYFMRVAPVGYRSDRLHLDVFYVIGAPASKDERYVFEAQLSHFFKLRYAKLVRISEYAKNAYRSKAKALYLKCKYLKYKNKWIKSQLESICGRYDPNSTAITIPVLGVKEYKHIYWETESLWDTMLCSTSKGVFRISRNYDKILTNIYGEYNKIYPLESRLNEIYKSYYLIKDNKKAGLNHSSKRYYMISNSLKNK